MSGPQGVILPGVGGTLNACAGLGGRMMADGRPAAFV